MPEKAAVSPSGGSVCRGECVLLKGCRFLTGVLFLSQKACRRQRECFPANELAGKPLAVGGAGNGVGDKAEHLQDLFTAALFSSGFCMSCCWQASR